MSNKQIKYTVSIDELYEDIFCSKGHLSSLWEYLLADYRVVYKEKKEIMWGFDVRIFCVYGMF